MAQQDHASDDGAQNGDEETPTLIGKTIENWSERGGPRTTSTVARQRSFAVTIR